MKTIHLQCLAVFALLLTACDAGQTKQDNVPTAITGIDHLADYLSVQNFGVDGVSGFQAGSGGSVVCCAQLPRRWHAGLTVVVNWNVTNWRDCGWWTYTRRVPVDRYEKVGQLYVHFLEGGAVRVVSSDIGPGIFRPNTDYPGPHDPIPRKEPWHVFGPQSTHCPHQEEPTIMERLK